MIDLEEIERTINELENTRDTSYRLCERLSWLYICRDHLRPTIAEADGVTQAMRGSEFLEACGGVSFPALMRVLDEHVSALHVVQPREYEALMSKIRALR